LEAALAAAAAHDGGGSGAITHASTVQLLSASAAAAVAGAPLVSPTMSDYVVVLVEEATGHTLRGRVLARTTLAEHQR
jgi:hypothetical protein